jgi:hypothetical protein
MKEDIWIVRSPDDDSVEEGEYDKAGVEGLSIDVAIPLPSLPQLPAGHGKASQPTSGAGMCGS